MSSAPSPSSASPTRDRLVRAAIDLLLDGDPRRFSVGAVAKRAGVSRQACYLHFRSRAELVVAATDRAAEDLALPGRVAALDDEPERRQVLRGFVRLSVEQAERLGPAVRAVDELRRLDPDVARSLAERPGGRAGAARRIAARWAGDPAVGAAALQALTRVEVCEQLLGAGWSTEAVVDALTRAAEAALGR